MTAFRFEKTEPLWSTSLLEWQDWKWQLRNSLKTIEDFSKVFTLTENEKKAFAQGEEIFKVSTTPYYASLAKDTPEDPLRLIMMPQASEVEPGAQQMLDPLGEKQNQKKSRLIHRYSDRVLYLVTDLCSVYCRYCTRKHFTGQEQSLANSKEHQQVLEYLRSHPGVREVILSGGDPLTLSDAVLDRILFDLRQIPHLEIIRIGSRMPVVAPQRISVDLTQMLRKHKPVYVMTHFNHPREITTEAATACENLVDFGVPVFNQMVLLNGINNHAAIVQALSRRLLYLRVKPYYMFQCDPSLGTDHLRTSIDDSMQIQKELWGHLSGLAMPNFAVDIPEGGGKTILTPNFEVGTFESGRRYRGWDGVEANYLNPKTSSLKKPQDFENYLSEWQKIQNSRN